MSRVICAGHVNWDITLRVDRLPEPDGEASIRAQTGAGGGSAANVAAGLAGLDVPVSLLGSVGDDDHGRATTKELAESGVDCDPVRTAAGETAVKYLVVDADGEVFVLGCSGVNEAFRADDLSETLLADADVLHLTSQRPKTAAALAERAADAGLLVSFDPGRRLGERDYSATLERADLVFLNDREATTALDQWDAGPDGTTTVVLKHGARGGEVRRGDDVSSDDQNRRGDDAVVSHPGFAVDPVDTTGAGDAFAAGFLASRLRGDDDSTALAVANACGALAARAAGARTAISWNAVADLVDG
ncbi:ribokinase [Halogranum gelatinilyticum]|uniref:Ribokinase n=1 Tax=Halogranum gelatinilyticum TaxID=660521 RepID=A0A1G9UC95_9EURY|nr:carbohydrate kinase family protein [Halogranum gelatinilyticum]SDM57566.1 ribokinase [Halogranum gelatinilyticum]